MCNNIRKLWKDPKNFSRGPKIEVKLLRVTSFTVFFLKKVRGQNIKKTNDKG